MRWRTSAPPSPPASTPSGSTPPAWASPSGTPRRAMSSNRSASSRRSSCDASEPARGGCAGRAALQALAEERDRVDVQWAEEIPVDPARPGMCRPRRDDVGRRDQEVDREVVRQHADPVGQDLQRVHRRQDGRRVADLALLAEDAVLEVAVAAALADPGAVAADTDRAA